MTATTSSEKAESKSLLPNWLVTVTPTRQLVPIGRLFPSGRDRTPVAGSMLTGAPSGEMLFIE